MMSARDVDLVVRDKTGRILAVVEVIARRALDRKTSYYYYDLALQVGRSSGAKYVFLIALNTADFFRVPREDEQEELVAKIGTRRIWRRYLRGEVPREGISHEYLEALVKRWFADLVDPRFARYLPEERKLVALGIIDDLKEASVHWG